MIFIIDIAIAGVAVVMLKKNENVLHHQ